MAQPSCFIKKAKDVLRSPAERGAGGEPIRRRNFFVRCH